jgi:antitoxin (DNA-binding transcriptional repressor) of toxin-antitoxin stability system
MSEEVTIDEIDAQDQFDSLLDQVELGSEFIITRQGRIAARLISAPACAQGAPR